MSTLECGYGALFPAPFEPSVQKASAVERRRNIAKLLTAFAVSAAVICAVSLGSAPARQEHATSLVASSAPPTRRTSLMQAPEMALASKVAGFDLTMLLQTPRTTELENAVSNTGLCLKRDKIIQLFNDLLGRLVDEQSTQATYYSTLENATADATQAYLDADTAYEPNPKFSTLNLQPSLNPQPSTLEPQPSTLNPQPSTRFELAKKTHSDAVKMKSLAITGNISRPAPPSCLRSLQNQAFPGPCGSPYRATNARVSCTVPRHHRCLDCHHGVQQRQGRLRHRTGTLRGGAREHRQRRRAHQGAHRHDQSAPRGARLHDHDQGRAAGAPRPTSMLAGVFVDVLAQDFPQQARLAASKSNLILPKSNGTGAAEGERAQDPEARAPHQVPDRPGSSPLST